MWRESIKTGIPVATLGDLALITEDPTAAFSTLADRAGIDQIQSSVNTSERKVSLGGWTIRMIDDPLPKINVYANVLPNIASLCQISTDKR